MKKIVLLGDSIRLIGYGETVARELADAFTVWQPADNCRYAKYTMRGLYEWRNELENVDIIHWNNGLWDLCTMVDNENFTPVELYVDEMVRLAGMLQKRAKTVIFATTTPVKPQNQNMCNGDIEAYNAAVLPRLAAMGIVINDLHSAVKENIDRYICDDLTHLSEEGITLCAGLVTEVIRREADRL